MPNAQGSIGWTREIASGAFRVALIAYIDLLQSRAVSVPPDLAGLLEATAGGLDDRGSELNQFRDQVDQLRLALVVMAEQLRKQALGR